MGIVVGIAVRARIVLSALLRPRRGRTGERAAVRRHRSAAASAVLGRRAAAPSCPAVVSALALAVAPRFRLKRLLSFPVTPALFVGPAPLFDAFLLLALLQLAVERIALPIPTVDADRRGEAAVVVLLSFQPLVRLPWPQPARFSFGNRGFYTALLLLLQLRIELFAQRRDLELDLVVGNVVVFELDAQLHAFHLDLALALVLQDRSVRLGVSHIGAEGG